MMAPILTLARPPFGADNRLSPMRAPFEFYPTPPEATFALLSVERFTGTIWEPACGDGAIARVLEAKGHSVLATDITNHGYGEHAQDFLVASSPRARNIVTNPPYGRGLADQFVRQALRFCDTTCGKVAMLMNITSLCHPMRHDSFIRRPPSRIWALDDCVCFPNGDPRQATGATRTHRYCWLIWDPAHKAGTHMGWLSTAGFASQAKPINEQLNLARRLK